MGSWEPCGQVEADWVLPAQVFELSFINHHQHLSVVMMTFSFSGRQPAHNQGSHTCTCNGTLVLSPTFPRLAPNSLMYPCACWMVSLSFPLFVPGVFCLPALVPLICLWEGQISKTASFLLLAWFHPGVHCFWHFMSPLLVL